MVHFPLPAHNFPKPLFLLLEWNNTRLFSRPLLVSPARRCCLFVNSFSSIPFPFYSFLFFHVFFFLFFPFSFFPFFFLQHPSSNITFNASFLHHRAEVLWSDNGEWRIAQPSRASSFPVSNVLASRSNVLALHDYRFGRSSNGFFSNFVSRHVP